MSPATSSLPEVELGTPIAPAVAAVLPKSSAASTVTVALAMALEWEWLSTALAKYRYVPAASPVVLDGDAGRAAAQSGRRADQRVGGVVLPVVVGVAVEQHLGDRARGVGDSAGAQRERRAGGHGAWRGRQGRDHRPLRLRLGPSSCRVL